MESTFFGRLFEDFVPVSERHALITTGRALNALDQIEMTEYTIDGDRVVLHGRRTILAAGKGLRLGGSFDGQLVYSCDLGVVGAQCRSPTAHQPFVRNQSLYYTDDWPNVRIYRDGDVFLDHFSDMVQVANPCWGRDCLYFEARSNPHPERPDLWGVWKLNGKPEFVCKGANPAYFDGKLFWGEWNGRNFDYRCASVD